MKIIKKWLSCTAVLIMSMIREDEENTKFVCLICLNRLAV